MEFLIENLQPALVDKFKTIIDHNQLGHAYLFSGPDGSGKKELAQWLAARLFCLNVTPDGEPCGECVACQQVISGNHPDLVIVEPTGQTIKTDAMREVKQEMMKSPLESDRRIFIINSVDKMTNGAANTLLKSLEEPVGNVLSILITNSPTRILPTILSRLQLIHFPPLTPDKIASQFQAAGIDPKQIPLLVKLTGDAKEAKEFTENENFAKLVDTIRHWVDRIEQGDDEAFVWVQTRILPLVSDKKEQELVLRLLAVIYENLLKQHYDLADSIFGANQKPTWLATLSTKKLLAQIESTLNAQKQWQQNVSFQNVLESLALNLIAIKG